MGTDQHAKTTPPPILALIALIAFSTPAAMAQTTVTAQSVVIGRVPGTVGCEIPAREPPVLSGGTPASGRIDFRYDAATHVLTLAVHNDSPVTPGVANPVLVQLAFNLPAGAVDGVHLLSQTALAGAQPSFELEVDKRTDPLLRMSCLGEFGVRLRTVRTRGAIGNPAASTFGVPSNSIAFGATFDLLLSGPGVRFLTARAIALSLSQNATLEPARTAAKFAAGGPSGTELGFLSAVEEPNLPGSSASQPVLWITSPPVQRPERTERFELCVGADPGLHGCLLGSLDPGPSVLAGFLAPIGFPTLTVAVPVLPPSGRKCFAVNVPPPPPSLVGLTTYLTFVTFVPLGEAPPASPAIPSLVEFSPRFDLKIE